MPPPDRTKGSRVYGKQTTTKRNEFDDLVAGMDGLKLQQVSIPPQQPVEILVRCDNGISEEYGDPGQVEDCQEKSTISSNSKRKPLKPRSENTATLHNRSHDDQMMHNRPNQNRSSTSICLDATSGCTRSPHNPSSDPTKIDVQAKPQSSIQLTGKKKPSGSAASSKAQPFHRESSVVTNYRQPRNISTAFTIKEIQRLTSLPDVDDEVKDFYSEADGWLQVFQITKIGQGSYASIFRLELLADPSVYTIWKLMPLKPLKGKGQIWERGTFVDDAAREIKALAAMSRSTGFVEFRSACILNGPMPPVLQTASKEWTKSHPEDEDNEPFPSEQLWVFIEMTDAGTDLEKVLEGGLPDCLEHGGMNRFRDYQTQPKALLPATQVWDIFWGVVEALAHGEEHAEFEHRDLHPGNICVKRSTSPSRGAQEQLVTRFTDLEITLIDYTLSRAKLDTGEVLTNSMQDKALFKQSSDIEPDRAQYNMYRSMRQAVAGGCTGGAETRRWKNFVPETNLLWLYHLLGVLLPQTASTERQDANTAFLDAPTENDQMIVDILRRLREALDPGKRESWPWKSAKDLFNHDCIDIDFQFGTDDTSSSDMLG